jgi:ribosomal protein S18 acetylase RimI-like enzyme
MQVIENGVTEDIFYELRQTGPFVDYGYEDTVYALKHSLYTVAIFDNHKPIGMARLVGDGRISFFIKDVVVLPKYRGQGIGKMLINNLFKYIKCNACYNAYIGLMSSPNMEGFYKKFGFITRPNEIYGAGMILYYKGDKDA